MLALLGAIAIVQAAWAQPRSARPPLTIRLYLYVELPADTVTKSMQAAAEALGRSSVDTAWEQCATPTAPHSDPSCGQRADSLVIQLRLHGKADAKKLQAGFDDFGYAVAPPEGLGVIAGVYVERARRLAHEQGLDLAPVLGHLMAHEIGHLLLGPSSHSRGGIMTRRWKKRELRLAVTGAFEFTPSQSDRMRQQVSVRFAARIKTAPTAVLAAAQPSATPIAQSDDYPTLLSQSDSSAAVPAVHSGLRRP